MGGLRKKLHSAAYSGTGCIIDKRIISAIYLLINFGGIVAGEVCGVCACPDFYHGITYVCIIITSSAYVLWYTYVLCQFNNIEVNIFYYLSFFL